MCLPSFLPHDPHYRGTLPLDVTVCMAYYLLRLCFANKAEQIYLPEAIFTSSIWSDVQIIRGPNVNHCELCWGYIVLSRGYIWWKLRSLYPFGEEEGWLPVCKPEFAMLTSSLGSPVRSGRNLRALELKTKKHCVLYVAWDLHSDEKPFWSLLGLHTKVVMLCGELERSRQLPQVQAAVLSIRTWGTLYRSHSLV